MGTKKDKAVYRLGATDEPAFASLWNQDGRDG